jgi:hypothetical protein
MPNWCTNIVKISSGSERDLDALFTLLKDTDEPFAVVFPQPDFEGEDDWYDWNIANWGTKWDADGFSISRNKDGTIEMAFATAWSPSIGVTARMAKDFPSLQIAHFYEEPGMCFEGVATFEGGSMIGDEERRMPEFDSEEESDEYFNTPLDERLS